MSKIEVTLKENILKIEKKTSRKSNNNIELIQTDILELGREYESKLCVTNAKEKDKVFFLESIEGEEDKVIVVYSNNNKIKYSYCNTEKAYKKLVQLRFRVLKISFTKKKLKIKVLAYVVNKYKRKIKEARFFIDGILNQQCTLKEYNRQISKIKMIEDKNIYTFKFNIEDIIKDDSLINSSIRFSLNIDGNDINYKIGIFDKKIKNTRYYYAPIKGKYIKDYAIHLRRTNAGVLVLVKRLKEPIENTLKFKIMENNLVSNILYTISKILIPIRKKKINVFYEKFSAKTEEGAYDLFLTAKKSKNTKNYFIIDENSKDYELIKNEKNVVKKYSLKYYWLIYNASNFIATDSPLHLSVLRSNNGALRKSFCDKKFVFLQHGVTYMKCHGPLSTYAKGREGASDYMIVGSEKEKDIVVEMLELDEEQIINAGLPIFSKIKYNHLNNESEDIVTVMLTWKPYEEQLYNFEESTYYKNVVEIYDILKKYVDKKKIIVIPHPKVQDLLASTDMKENIWKKPISEALKKSKLLITDYSSVCYNSFYQGGGVIFYQEDIERYEEASGKLIPNDDEYIGKRTFNMEELENVIKDTIKNGKIDLSIIRTKKHEDNYKTINEFTDGKNIERIYEELVKKGLV